MVKNKYFVLAFLLLILFLFYGCGEKNKVEVAKEFSETPIDSDVDEVGSLVSDFDDTELDEIESDLDLLEDI